ncbi:hypothetical protein Hanom_Chr16g01449211 [Helianthus anomalus]
MMFMWRMNKVANTPTFTKRHHLPSFTRQRVAMRVVDIREPFRANNTSVEDLILERLWQQQNES